MSTGIIPKKTINKTPLWKNVLFFVSIIFFLAAVGSYFYLNHLEKQLGRELKSLGEIVQYEIVAFEEDKEFVREMEARIKTFGSLVGAHPNASVFFDYLEEVIHPKVWFKEVRLDVSNSEVFLSGEAESFVALKQQILILEEFKAKIEEDEALVFKEINLKSISLGEKGVVFDLQISLSPEHFII